MKKIIIWIVALLLLVGVIAGASVLYKKLSGEYSGVQISTDVQNLLQNTSQNKDEGTQPSTQPSTQAGTQSSTADSPDESNAPSSDEPSETRPLESAAPESDAPEFTAPDFTVLDMNGNSVKLSDFQGKPIVLNFWATWCYYCELEMPDFNEAYKKYPDVQFVMVNATDGVQETVSGVKKYIQEKGYDFEVFFDTKGEAAAAYYVSGYPMTFFIDESGAPIVYANGMIDLATLEECIGMITK